MSTLFLKFSSHTPNSTSLSKLRPSCASTSHYPPPSLSRSCAWETSTTLTCVTPSTYPSRSTGSSLCGIHRAPGSSATASVRVRAQPLHASATRSFLFSQASKALAFAQNIWESCSYDKPKEIFKGLQRSVKKGLVLWGFAV